MVHRLYQYFTFLLQLIACLKLLEFFWKKVLKVIYRYKFAGKCYGNRCNYSLFMLKCVFRLQVQWIIQSIDCCIWCVHSITVIDVVTLRCCHNRFPCSPSSFWLQTRAKKQVLGSFGHFLSRFYLLNDGWFQIKSFNRSNLRQIQTSRNEIVLRSLSFREILNASDNVMVL